jgi:DNA gyrase subunit A
VVDELPYQVNKKTLQERMAELVHEKKIEGISHIQDESDKSGMRLVIELKRGEVPEVVLNNLYKQTQLQDTFGINMVALIDGQPKLCNLKDLISVFLQHRREVVTRRTVFTLRKARERGHVLEGLAVAMANIDEFIAIIRNAPTPPVAKAELMTRSWDSKLVREMLTRTRADGGAVNGDDYRPDGLEKEFGMGNDGLYRLSKTRLWSSTKKSCLKLKTCSTSWPSPSAYPPSLAPNWANCAKNLAKPNWVHAAASLKTMRKIWPPKT